MTAALTPGRPFAGTERQLLVDTLQLHRSELLVAVDGLSEAQARMHLVPSLTTPIALVKHCAAAERIWFQRTLAGRRVEDCTGQAVGGDGSFHVADHETLAQVWPNTKRHARRQMTLPPTTVSTTPSTTTLSAQ